MWLAIRLFLSGALKFIFANWKPILIGLVCLALFGSGVYVEKGRKDKEIAELKAQFAKMEKDRNDSIQSRIDTAVKDSHDEVKKLQDALALAQAAGAKTL